MSRKGNISEDRASQRLYVTPSQRKRFERLATLDTTRRELFDEVLTLYEIFGVNGSGLIRRISLLTRREGESADYADSLMKIGKIFGLMIGLGEGFDIEVVQAKKLMLSLVESLEDGNIIAVRVKLLVNAFQGLIEQENLKELEPIFRNAVEVIMRQIG